MIRDIDTAALRRRLQHIDADRDGDVRAQVGLAMERVGIRVELERREATRTTAPPPGAEPRR